MSGALSGTLGIYKVNGLDHKCSYAADIASALIYTMLAILVVVVIGSVVYSNQQKPATEAEGAKEIATEGEILCMPPLLPTSCSEREEITDSPPYAPAVPMANPTSMA